MAGPPAVSAPPSTAARHAAGTAATRHRHPHASRTRRADLVKGNMRSNTSSLSQKWCLSAASMCNTAIANSTSLRVSMRRSQQLERAFVLADQIGPGEQAEPADRIVLGGGHHPAGERHREQEHIERHVRGARCQPLERPHGGAAAPAADARAATAAASSRASKWSCRSSCAARAAPACAHPAADRPPDWRARIASRSARRSPSGRVCATAP